MKQFFKLNLINISISPLAWGCLAFIATIVTIDKSDQNYFFIAFVLCLLIPLFLSLRSITIQIKSIVIMSIMFAIGSYAIRLYNFNEYYQREQTALDRYALIEDAITTSIGEQKYMHKIIAYDVDFADRYMVNFVTNKIVSIPIGQCIIIPSQKKHFPHNKNFRNYLLKTEIHEAIFLYSHPAIHSFETKSIYLKIKQYFLLKKQNLLNYIHDTFSPQSAYFFNLIFLSKTPNYDETTNNIRKAFADWGILHIIARSGLHLMVLFILFGHFFCMVPMRLRTSIIMIPIFFYACMSWFSISFGRSLVSLSLTSYATIKKYIIRPLDILITTTYIFLLYNPFVLFALDFQLSFGITAILCFIYEIEQSKTLALPR